MPDSLSNASTTSDASITPTLDLQALYEEFGLTKEDEEQLPEEPSDNSLKSWCLANGEWGARLLKEFNTEENDAHRVYIDRLTYGSNKEVIWTCQ